MPNLSLLQRMYNERKISRRQFITEVSALGLAAAVSPTLFSGNVMAATPQKGGTFRQALTGGATSDSLDPGTPFRQPAN